MLFCLEVAILNKQVHVVLGAKYNVLTFEIERVYLSHSTAVIYFNWYFFTFLGIKLYTLVLSIWSEFHFLWLWYACPTRSFFTTNDCAIDNSIYTGQQILSQFTGAAKSICPTSFYGVIIWSMLIHNLINWSKIVAYLCLLFTNKISIEM